MLIDTTITENIRILKRELTYKNNESMEKVLQVVEQINSLALTKEITLDQCEQYIYLLFELYDKLKP